jgi:phage terminase large subunit-like protein
MVHPVTQYALDVVYGDKRKDCGKWEVLACQRHLHDLNRQGTDAFPFAFDETRADRIVDYYRMARHVSGCYSGQAIALLDWQVFDFGSLYGWVREESGKRRYKTGYIREARGQAKSLCLSVLGCYTMTSDAYYPPGHPELATYESSPEVVCSAVDRGQANIVRDDIHLIASSSPKIGQRLDIKKLTIRHKTRGGKVVALSKDKRNKDGGRPNLIIVDEYHEHPDDEIRNTTKNGKGKKAQCLEVIITTAGTDAENKPCFREDKLCKQILEGTVVLDDYFVMIREIDDEDDPHDESCWKKSTPMFRGWSEYSRGLYDEVKSEHDTAYASGDPSKIRAFLIKRMNRWQTDSENKYMSGIMDKFKAGRVTREEFAKRTDGQKFWTGFDLGKTQDLSGTGAVTYLESEGVWAFKVHGFMPQHRAIEHEHSDRVPYTYWAQQGYVTLTPGSVTENSYVEMWLVETAQDHRWDVQEIGYDGHNATDMAGRLSDYYNKPEMVVEIYQTCASLNAATKKFREVVLQGNFIYEESALFEWCLANAIEVTNVYGDIKLNKKHKDDTQRIDPVAALINAMTRAMKNEMKDSAYESRGILLV